MIGENWTDSSSDR